MSALKDPKITAIEADILIGRQIAGIIPGQIPIMAHPPQRTSDLSFEDFWDACLSEGRHHLKLDFKELRALQGCLPKIFSSKWRLAAQRQAVWINADILPGPNRREGKILVPAEEFFAAVAKECPGVPLSLGWRVHYVGFEESYSMDDITSMLEVCKWCSNQQEVVFAASARLALCNPRPLLELLKQKPTSQLLLWTGTGEPSLPLQSYESLARQFAEVRDRVGYDCKITESSFVTLAGELKIHLAQMANYLCNC